jgi:hypothetical protein
MKSDAHCPTKRLSAFLDFNGSKEMYRITLAAVVCIACSAAAAQEDSKSALKKWRACADAAAVRYAKSTESAQVVSRYAIMSCRAEKQTAWQALSQESGAHFADDYVETAERGYADLLAIDVIEMRLKQ